MIKVLRCRYCFLILVGWICVSPFSCWGEMHDDRQPSTVLSVYDSGFVLFSEWRSFQLKGGENSVDIFPVPATTRPSTLALVATKVGQTPQLLECWLVPPSANERGAQEDAVGRLRCRLASLADGPVWVRTVYGAEGLGWTAHYVITLWENEPAGALSVRVALENRLDMRISNAWVRLVETERAQVPMIQLEQVGVARRVPGWRYVYGRSEPVEEKIAATPALARTFEVRRPIDIPKGATVYAVLIERNNVPLTHFYVYDGMVIERTDANPRTDWNYGTRSHSVVEQYLEIPNTKEAGLGMSLPAGRLLVVRSNRDGSSDVVGVGEVDRSEPGDVIRAHMGPARGLRGFRERVSYAEIVPFREFEESFEIRLENLGNQEVEVRVVEHLYRSASYEIVKADAEFRTTGPQTIEFTPLVKPKGLRSIRYTVRYRW